MKINLLGRRIVENKINFLLFTRIGGNGLAMSFDWERGKKDAERPANTSQSQPQPMVKIFTLVSPSSHCNCGGRKEEKSSSHVHPSLLLHQSPTQRNNVEVKNENGLNAGTPRRRRRSEAKKWTRTRRARTDILALCSHLTLYSLALTLNRMPTII